MTIVATIVALMGSRCRADKIQEHSRSTCPSEKMNSPGSRSSTAWHPSCKLRLVRVFCSPSLVSSLSLSFFSPLYMYAFSSLSLCLSLSLSLNVFLLGNISLLVLGATTTPNNRVIQGRRLIRVADSIIAAVPSPSSLLQVRAKEMPGKKTLTTQEKNWMPLCYVSAGCQKIYRAKNPMYPSSVDRGGL